MDTLELIKTRRSIRKYADRQVPREDVEKVLEAGIYAANAGGGQRSMMVAVRNAGLAARIGRMNMAGFSRTGLVGNYVSHDQPSVIDNPAIKMAFTMRRPYFASSARSVFCLALPMRLPSRRT